MIERDAAEEAAFLARYREVAPALLTWSRLRVTGSVRRWIEPEELVQEVWVRALGRYGTFDQERGSFRSWVFGIATNVLIEVLRQVGRRAGPWRPGDTASFAASQVADEATAISRRVARDEILRSFAEKVAALPEEERMLLIYRGLEGLSHREIAERLGTTRDVAMKRWQRLRDRLMQEALPADLLVH